MGQGYSIARIELTTIFPSDLIKMNKTQGQTEAIINCPYKVLLEDADPCFHFFIYFCRMEKLPDIFIFGLSLQR